MSGIIQAAQARLCALTGSQGLGSYFTSAREHAQQLARQAQARAAETVAAGVPHNPPHLGQNVDFYA